MPASAAVYGCQGPELAPDERDFFRDVRPFGFILFARQCRALRRKSLRCATNCATRSAMPNAPILIDQEGGRVQRLKPPHWQNRPAARRFGELFDRHPDQGREAAYLCARLIAHDLRSVGVTVNCAPVLDVPVEGAHDIIGDRAYSLDPATVIELGRATIDGYLDGGVLPVIKHMPGHGRAMADSHLALPRVHRACERAQRARLRHVPQPQPGADRDDRPCRLRGHRSAASGHDEPQGHSQYHSRRNRIRRLACQRRSLHVSARGTA